MSPLVNESQLTVLVFLSEEGERFSRQVFQDTTRSTVKWSQHNDDGSLSELSEFDQQELEKQHQCSASYEGWLTEPLYNSHYHVSNTETGEIWITQIQVSPDYTSGSFFKWFITPQGERVRLDMHPQGTFLFKQIKTPNNDIHWLKKWKEEGSAR